MISNEMIQMFIDAVEAENKKLQAENNRLREALKSIASFGNKIVLFGVESSMEEIARQALERNV